MAFCKQCGASLVDGARFCSNCAAAINSPAVSSIPTLASVEAPKKRAGVFRLIVLGFAAVFGVGLLMLLISSGTSSSSSSAVSAVASNGESSPSLRSSPAYAVQPEEEGFIQAVQKAQTGAGSAENDMQKGGMKSERDHAICGLLNSLNHHVGGWVGIVQTVDSNSDGWGILSLQIEKGIVITTWNNSFSDIGTNTLINPDSPVFKAASKLRPGQTVDFSGDFPTNPFSGGCFVESSLTLNGKIDEPEFIFRFSEVGPAEPMRNYP